MKNAILALILILGIKLNGQQITVMPVGVQMISPQITGGMTVSGPITIGGNAFITTTPYQTNWSSGALYTNFLPNAVRVSAVVSNLPSAVLGSCGIELWVAYSTNVATMYPADASTSATVIAGPTAAQQFSESAMIPSGGYWCFTNLSTGAGNNATIRKDSGQYTILP